MISTRRRPAPGDLSGTGARTRWNGEQGEGGLGTLSGLVLTLSEPKAVISSGAVSPAIRSHRARWR